MEIDDKDALLKGARLLSTWGATRRLVPGGRQAGG